MTDAITTDLLAFLDAAPSPYHAVSEVAARLLAAGFVEHELTSTWATSAGGSFVRRGGALVAWFRPDGAAPSAPIHLIGAHTDSPNLRLKPRPDSGGFGWRQLAVELYGGLLMNSWLDRDLGLSGRLVTRDGVVHLVRVDEPWARVPQLAIHLDRAVNESGLVLDKQQHLSPIIGLGAPGSGDVLGRIATTVDVDPMAIGGFDLMLHDLTPPALIGIDRDLVASARIDNLASCHAAVVALLAAIGSGETNRVAMIALFDHEEVGSESATGAAGPLLEDVIVRQISAAGGDADDVARSLAGSWCASADMAHGVHPNYPERHEPGHRPLPNGGPVVKVNASQRYATDAISHARFVAGCERVGVPHQVFVSKNSMPCGSTIGPITSTRLGIRTVDVGCAMLSMHSARELMGASDQALYVNALSAWLH
jgi:aspartyl aminopeptidase